MGAAGARYFLTLAGFVINVDKEFRVTKMLIPDFRFAKRRDD
jgi:hypothetical protein